MLKSKEDGAAISTVLIENYWVLVTRWHFPQSGDCIGWHRYKQEYVIVPLFYGELRIDSGSKTVTSSLTTGGSYFH